MSDPRAEALKALMPPNMREILAHPRSPVGRIATYAEAVQLLENIMAQFSRTPRLPIQATCNTEPDGSLTIRVTPTG